MVDQPSGAPETTRRHEPPNGQAGRATETGNGMRTARADGGRLGYLGFGLAALGVATILLVHWMVVFWVPTEAVQGVVQRIFYVHVPAAWTFFFAVPRGGR